MGVFLNTPISIGIMEENNQDTNENNISENDISENDINQEPIIMLVK